MKAIICTLILVMSLSLLSGQNIWTQKADYGGCERAFGFSFVINDKAYVGGGEAYGCGFDFNTEVWEYTPSTNQWEQKADLPVSTYNLHAFSIGDQGYIVARSNNPGTDESQVWQYSPATDLWVQLDNFPGDSRSSAIAFTISNKGYYGLGSNSAPYKTDLWEYDPTQDLWTQKADMPLGRRASTAFTIGTKAYVGLGSGLKDFWEYDPLTDVWTSKADFGGSARQFAVGFTIGGKGYVGTGFDGNYKSDFWEYDNINNSWQEVDNMPGPVRQAAVAFTINDKGYLTNGYDGSFTVIGYKDLWEFAAITPISEFQHSNLSIFPNPATDKIVVESIEGKIQTLNIFSVTGELLMSSRNIDKNILEIDISELAKGVYIVEASSQKFSEMKKIVVD